MNSRLALISISVLVGVIVLLLVPARVTKDVPIDSSCYQKQLQGLDIGCETERQTQLRWGWALQVVDTGETGELVDYTEKVDVALGVVAALAATAFTNRFIAQQKDKKL